MAVVYQASNLLNEDGLLTNPVTSYQLQGAAAAAFKGCVLTCQADLSCPPSTYLDTLWHEMLASKTVAQLSVDDQFLLLLEVGLARIAMEQDIKKQAEHPVFDFLHAKLDGTLSHNIKMTGKCLLSLCYCQALTEFEGPDVSDTIHKLTKDVVVDAKSITDPQYNSTMMEASAWVYLAAAFISSGQHAAAITMLKKHHARRLLSITQHPAQGLTGQLSQGTLAMMSLLPHSAMFMFVERHVHKAFAMMAPACAATVVRYVRAFMAFVTMAPCCALGFPQCDTHPVRMYIYGALPTSLETLLATGLPTCVSPVTRHNWAAENFDRTRVAANGFGLEAKDVWALTVPPTLFIATLDKLLHLHPRAPLDGDPSKSQFKLDDFGRVLLGLVPASGDVGELTKPASAAERKQAAQLASWAEQVDPWLAHVGLSVTLAELVQKYAALDKNIARGLPDRELLPMLGLSNGDPVSCDGNST